MSLAKDINELLDNLLDIKAEIKRMNADITPDQMLKNVQTGESMTKEQVVQFVEDKIIEIKNKLNKITNDGKNVKDIFTNKFYVNDSMQDREIINKINTKENVLNKDNAPKEYSKAYKSIKYKSGKFKKGQFKEGYREISEEEMKRIWKKYKKKDFLDDFNDNDLPF